MVLPGRQAGIMVQVPGTGMVAHVNSVMGGHASLSPSPAATDFNLKLHSGSIRPGGVGRIYLWVNLTVTAQSSST